MNTYEIIFAREGKRIQVPEGTTILEAQRMAGLNPDAPCGGKGTCGKCLVQVTEGEQRGIMKACQTRVMGNMTIDTLIREKEYVILTEGLSRSVSLNPMLRFGKIKIPKVKLGSNISDWDRLKKALEETFHESMDNLEPDLKLASDLYTMLKETDVWYVVLGHKKILNISKDPIRSYVAAFDIGTTTVVGYLVDVLSGKVLGAESRMNPQAQFGADVIMRADYALENGTLELSSCIRSTVQVILEALAEKYNITTEDIYQISVVGNTCMHHLFLGISPGSLVHAPYTPVISQLLYLEAEEYDLKIHQGGQLILLPDIAGFVGADTIGCLLCTRPDLKDEITLMIDIGTNGEMVLGNKEQLTACSTAAGPAFEGAKIECGMRGATGAVDHVKYEDGVWSYTTVGNEKAIGICGSGLIDLVACMRKAGLIDETGKLTVEDDGNKFILVPAKDSGEGKAVYLSQKDIREVQLAKAAIAAGIQLLMQEIQIKEEQIASVYIAGAFGNYMDAESACQIGLIPMSLKKKILPIGNAAGEGAKIALLNQEELKQSEILAKEVAFVELASSPDFQDCFVDELEFPDING